MILGLTGNIASGKSTIAAELRKRGAVIIDADQLARQVVEPGSPTLEKIAEVFGSQVLTIAGGLDRDLLGRLIFADESKRNQLNAIIHPAIAALADAQMRELAGRRDVPLLVYEAPLLYEVGADARVDRVLLIRVDPQVQLQRLMSRNGFSELEARQRIASQMDQAEKERRADFVIDNSGSLEQTLGQVDQFWSRWVASGDEK